MCVLTKRLNAFLGRSESYTEAEVNNKVDSMKRKAKEMYNKFKR